VSWITKPRHPSYHLRPNKAVDRLVLIELLRAFEHVQSLEDHVYVGFGGPFLEDFRLVNAVFPNLEMISIKSDRETYERQKFHLCSRNMEAKNCQFEEFLSTMFPSDRPTIVWADYTDLDRKCFIEGSDVARQAAPWSVYRITVRAETSVYDALKIEHRPEHLPKHLQQEFASFRRDYLAQMTVEGVSYDEDRFNWENFTEENYPALLAHMILSVLSASCTRPKTFLPLNAAKYSDGTIMLSVTGVFCEEEDRERLLEHFKRTCPLYLSNSETVDEIDVPVLTTKERLHLEGLLPTRDCDGISCLRGLGYLIEGDDSKVLSTRKMKHYEKYYRLYPYFAKLLP